MPGSRPLSKDKRPGGQVGCGVWGGGGHGPWTLRGLVWALEITAHQQQRTPQHQTAAWRLRAPCGAAPCGSTATSHRGISASSPPKMGACSRHSWALGIPRKEKATNQAWTSAPRVQRNNDGAFGARSTRWLLTFRARRSDETHQQVTAPQPCTGGRAMRRRSFSAAHPRRPGSGAVRNQQQLKEAAGLGARAGSAACRATQRDIIRVG